MSMRLEAKPVKVKAKGESFSRWGTTVLKMAPAKKIAMIREGVKVTILVDARQYYGISQTEISKLLGISDATIARKIKSGGKLGPLESERLTRIALVEAIAEEAFGSADLAKRWMLEDNLVLGDAPLSLLDTDTGASEVKKVLASIAYGGVA